MKAYIYAYVEMVESVLKEQNVEKLLELKDEMLVKIAFFQHERLIHLIITLFYVLMFLIFFILISVSVIFVVPVLLLLIFILFYIVHYFRLENKVQSLYKLYDEVVDSSKKEKMRQKGLK